MTQPVPEVSSIGECRTVLSPEFLVNSLGFIFKATFTSWNGAHFPPVLLPYFTHNVNSAASSLKVQTFQCC